MSKHNFVFIAVVSLLMLQGCSSARDSLGLNKSAPDEFAVVKRAPLSFPPNFNLRPPQPGAPRPQEQQTSEQAREALLGRAGSNVSSDLSDGEQAFLKSAGATSPAADIRRQIDSEVFEDVEDDRPVAQKLLGIGGSDGSDDVINAREELERLRGESETNEVSQTNDNIESEDLLYEGDTQEP